jgi:hypothetical protein
VNLKTYSTSYTKTAHFFNFKVVFLLVIGPGGPVNLWDAVRSCERLKELGIGQCQLLSRKIKKVENKARRLSLIKGAKSQLENENMHLEEICNWRYFKEVFELFTL